MSMGRSVPTYREELMKLISEWSGFRRALKGAEREAFDELIISAKKHITAGQNQANPDPMETMLLSILLEHRLILDRIERRLQDERMDIGHLPRLSEGEDDYMVEEQ